MNSSGCDIDTTKPGLSCECDYIPPAIKDVKAKKDEHGNWLVMVNNDGVWRGATLDRERMTLEFSY